MADEILTKTPEQIAEESAVISHVITDPQEWIDRAIANNIPWAIDEKVNKYRQEYLSAKYLAITVDPETGIETRVENPDYLNRAQRDALEELKRDPLYGKNLAETATIIKARINAECQSAILARFSLIYQLNISNGLYLDNGATQWIENMINESNLCHELIDTKATIEEVKAVVPTWPEFVEVI